MRAGRPLDILAFEPFDSGSHRAVRESISRHSRHRWRWVTRPGRAWKWRMRLAAIEMAKQAADGGGLDEPADIVFGTSLMSASDLRAALPPAWRSIPLVMYWHENQAAYPPGVVRFDSQESAGQPPDVQFALTNLTSALCADLNLWNSAWNFRSFVRGISAVLEHAPDASVGDVEKALTNSSRVIWPPVEPPPPGALRESASAGVVRVLWNHRWEHDKGPDELVRIAEAHSERLNLRWTILGEQFRAIPPEFELFQRRFADRIDHFGHVADRETYWRRLASCQWVLSTARHEFFGIGVVEAMLAGCLPWLPDRLSYSELLPERATGLSPLGPLDASAVQSLRSSIRDHLRPALAAVAVGRLDEALEDLAERHRAATGTDRPIRRAWLK